MPPSLRRDLVPRTAAQWMALLGLIPFAIGAWMQGTRQREIRIATAAVDQRLVELERRLGDLALQAGSVGVQVAVTDAPTRGSDSLHAASSATAVVSYDSLDDGVRALHAENETLAREFDRLTRLREQLRSRRGALAGFSTANILLAIGALITVAGVLTDIRQFRQQRRRAA